MTSPLSDTRLTVRAEILAALSAAGAFCGECGFEPGDTGCADCVRVRELYADAVMPIVERQLGELLFWHFEFREAMDNYHGAAAEVKKLRAELAAWQAAQDAVMALADDVNTPVTLAQVAKAHAHALIATPAAPTS